MKVALITGSSKGLGKAIAESFAKKQYNIVINYHVHEKEALLLQKELKEKYNVQVLCIKADVKEEHEIKNMISKVMQTFGKIDVLINNAGICKETPMIEKDKQTFHETLDTNLIGPFLTSKYVGEIMKNQKCGKIINVSSTNAFTGHFMSMEYDASKLALLSLTKNFAMQLAPYVNVNAIVPGYINTDMNKIEDEELNQKFIEEESKHILLGRFAEPDEIASVVLFLASDEARYINGSFIVVDGGVM